MMFTHVHTWCMVPASVPVVCPVLGPAHTGQETTPLSGHPGGHKQDPTVCNGDHTNALQYQWHEHLQEPSKSLMNIMSLESQKGTITIQRCSVENQKGTITIQRCSVENQKGTITIQRCSVENQKGIITIQRCAVENQKGAITIQRCSVENQKGIITIQRCSVENQKGVITIKGVPLRTKRALLPWTLYSNSTLLVLDGTLWILIAPFWLSTDDMWFKANMFVLCFDSLPILHRTKTFFCLVIKVTTNQAW